MIVPTGRAVAAMAIGTPIATALAIAQPTLWIAGPAWIATILLLMAADALAMRRRTAFTPVPDFPATIETARPATGRFHFEGRPPPGLHAILEADERLAIGSTTPFHYRLTARRRGTALLARLHLRWPGPLGLVRRITPIELQLPIMLVPQISLVREEAIRLFSRTRASGQALQLDLADSMEFHALREYQAGDDPRGVNWRHSARHATLLVRETRAERNRTIMLAIDTGRLMSAPLAGGLPRLDHAINAALVLAYVALKLGDRAGLFAFDTKPVQSTGTVRGTAAFATLQRMAATLDYSTNETNFTLGLTELGAQLGSRSLVVVMTDFADATGAELMLENVGRLLTRHVVLFVAFRDDELTAMADAPPTTPDDIARAVVAGSLLAARDLVLTRLRHLGAELIETPATEAGPALIRRYMALKRQDRL